MTSPATTPKINFYESRVEIKIDDTTTALWVRDHVSDRPRKARVYVEIGRLNILEHLINRERRPYVIWKQLALEALTKIGVTDVKLRWSQRAGCSCPCSPGFIVEDGGTWYGLINGTLYLAFTNGPTIDESIPARTVVEI